MLTLDMTNLSQATLEYIVARHCSHFGRATIHKLVPPDDYSELGAAEVEMPTLDEADSLARKFGDTRRGARVLIMLVQEEQATARTMSKCGSSAAQPIPERLAAAC